MDSVISHSTSISQTQNLELLRFYEGARAQGPIGPAEGAVNSYIGAPGPGPNRVEEKSMAPNNNPKREMGAKKLSIIVTYNDRNPIFSEHCLPHCLELPECIQPVGLSPL